MKMPRFFVAVILAASPVAALAADPADWTGRYAYHEDLGRDAVGAGISIGVDHRLHIGRGCRLEADGYQTNTRIRCIARARGNTLQVTFLSFGDGRLVNQYGVRVYSVGQPLLTLTRTPRGIVTTWQAYSSNNGPSAGRFFRRAS